MVLICFMSCPLFSYNNIIDLKQIATNVIEVSGLVMFYVLSFTQLQ
jgi:hypothetical protein